MTPTGLPVGVLAFRRPSHLLECVTNLLDLSSSTRIFISVDDCHELSSSRDRKLNTATRLTALELQERYSNVSLINVATGRGIIQHAFSASAKILATVGSRSLILLEDDHILTSEGLTFLETNLAMLGTNGSPVLVSAYAREVHQYLSASTPRRTSYPTLWGIGLTTGLLEHAFRIWTSRRLNIVRILAELSWSRNLPSSAAGAAYFIRTLQIGIASRNHFDALVTAAALSLGERIVVPSRPLLVDTGGGVDSYSRRTPQSDSISCGSVNYSGNGVCPDCEMRRSVENARALVRRIRG